MNLKFEVQSRFDYLPFLNRLFPSLRSKDAAALRQILVEAFNNAVAHAHRGNPAAWIGVEIERNASRTRIRILDAGRDRGAKNTRKTPGRWAVRGRGLWLIDRLADKWRFVRKGRKQIFEALKNHAT